MISTLSFGVGLRSVAATQMQFPDKSRNKREVISLAEQATKKNTSNRKSRGIFNKNPTTRVQNSPTLKFPSKLSLCQLFIDIIDALLEFENI